MTTTDHDYEAEARDLRGVLEQAASELADYRDDPTNPGMIAKVSDFVEVAKDRVGKGADDG